MKEYLKNRKPRGRQTNIAGNGLALAKLLFDVCAVYLKPENHEDMWNVAVFSIQVWKNWNIYEENHNGIS